MSQQRFIQPQRQGTSSLTGEIRNSQLTFPKSGGYAAHLNGVRQRQNRVTVNIGTDGFTQYTAQEWVDETTGDTRYSCNCPGWTRINPRFSDRWCKHTQQLAEDLTIGLTERPTIPNEKPSTSNHKHNPVEPGNIVAPHVRRRIG